MKNIIKQNLTFEKYQVEDVDAKIAELEEEERKEKEEEERQQRIARGQSRPTLAPSIQADNNNIPSSVNNIIIEEPDEIFPNDNKKSNSSEIIPEKKDETINISNLENNNDNLYIDDTDDDNFFDDFFYEFLRFLVIFVEIDYKIHLRLFFFVIL